MWVRKIGGGSPSNPSSESIYDRRHGRLGTHNQLGGHDHGVLLHGEKPDGHTLSHDSHWSSHKGKTSAPCAV